jgi:ABC-type transport system involved in Fe-S cluster assembly fused permease/ATPase subunit
MEIYSVGFSIGTIGFIIVYVFFVKNLMDLLLNVQAGNRQVQPGIVWILLLHFLPTLIEIPLNLGWLGYEYFSLLSIVRNSVTAFMVIIQFYLFVKIANSVSLEYDNRGIYYEHKPTFLAGIWLAIAYASIFLLNLFGILYLSIFAVIGYFIAFIVYWFQVWQVKKKLSNTSIKIETTEEDSIFKDL